MNGAKIEKILSKRLGKQFKGVYSYDQWRSLKIEPKPASYVFNTQPSHVEFGHWIGIYIKKDGTAIFFDSFGRSPDNLGFLNFLEKHAKSWQYNNVHVQNPFTAVCGQHVICFLIKAHFSSVTDWLKLFSSSLLTNDNIVYNLIGSKYKVQASLYPDVHVFI